ncbi:DUF3152 domain-containing protein [Nocardioides sp.]|uniref:DUF3152 domain-containing protein n=1 Tax=Nocardioides sp. TaxID=35761 RepID=UPI0039E2DA82
MSGHVWRRDGALRGRAGHAVVLLALVAALLVGPAPAHADDPAPGSTDPAQVLTATGGQRVKGTARLGRTLRVRTGRWSMPLDSLTVRWLRDGEPIVPARKAGKRRYQPTWRDVGHRLSVRITAVSGIQTVSVDTASTTKVKHLHDVRRTIRYEVRSRGNVTADLATFEKLAQQTYDDPRGWRAAGIRFVRVESGGSMTLWLAAASELPRFSAQCSSQWSCRVGRNVVVNQDRWQGASSSWNAAGGSLRDYRHLVVNHETGHFLGLGHSGCPHPGAPAPVMMQQSKGLSGCRFNPWPTAAEIAKVSP